MTEIELEKTYLAKYLPKDFEASKSKEIKDIYIPKDIRHPVMRIRQKGDKYEITKKEPIKDTDSSEQTEQTINLTREEFQALEQAPGKKVHKIRYYYNHEGIQAEIDIFQGDLKGLVLIDFEFKEVVDKNNFEMPDFCLVEVTQDELFAGGILCGKKYSDIENHLEELGYKKID